MKSLCILLALAAVPLSDFQSGAPLAPIKGCGNLIAHEPALVYEVTGGTLAGPYDVFLTVYHDGSARLVDLRDPASPRGAIASADPEVVGMLLADLAHIGALRQCDQQGMVTDVPLHTLTLVKPGTESAAHTYSWWIGEGPNSVVEFRIDQFIASTFPGFFGGK